MYKPHRTERYEYAIDVIQYVESYQCVDCKFAEAMPESWMCWEAQGNILLELPVRFMNEEPNGKVVCNRYERIPR